MVPEITFSHGQSIHDNKPRPATMPDFAAFIDALDRKRAPKKEGAGYFCGPLNGDGTRRAEGALPRNWIALDLDHIEPEVHDDLRMWFTRFIGAGWPTHSSTEERPRMRVVLELDRQATREECMEVGRALTHELDALFGRSVMLDPSTFRGEQPIFFAPTGKQLARYEGEALEVGRYLASASVLPKMAAAPGKNENGKVGHDRNDYLSRKAYAFARSGLQGEALAAALLVLNAQDCDPPLGDDEVRGIAARKKIVPAEPTPPAPPRFTVDQPQQDGQQPEGDALQLLSIDELDAASKRVTWTIKHVLPADSIGVMFGAPGTFKSFIALDMALHIAHGMPWLGKRTKQGPVIYLAAEGGTGLMKRIRAWHAMHGRTWEAIDFRVIAVPVMLNSNAMAVTEAARAVGLTPTLVVVDTKSQTDEGEENSSTDTANYFRQLGVCFRALWNCTVLVIHHSGHSATERPRGSSAILGNVDFMYGVFRDEKEMLATLECVRQKDVELFAPANFAMNSHDLGRDEDGDPINSLVAVQIGTTEQLISTLSNEAKAGRKSGNSLLMALAVSGQPEKELRNLFYSELEGKDTEARRKAYFRARRWAIENGLLDIADGVVIVMSDH